MARKRGTSRVTEPGSSPAGHRRGAPTPQEFPSIRERKPVLYWTVVIATLALVIPLVAGLIQAFL